MSPIRCIKQVSHAPHYLHWRECGAPAKYVCSRPGSDATYYLCGTHANQFMKRHAGAARVKL